MGAANQSAIGTLLERRARYLMLVHVPGAHTADVVRHGVSAAFAALLAALRGTLTWDQGKEMAEHQQLATQTGLGVYFCDAHSPWQRGSNESMNGLLRQYSPKGTDLRNHTVAAAQAVGQAVLLAMGQVVRGGAQDVADAVERVAGVSAVARVSCWTRRRTSSST